MKPSEYLFNEDFMILNDDYKLKVINKLDKRFIDREELYKQIKEILDESLTKACLKAMEDKDLLKDKINKILNEFAKATDVDGRETLYKYTDCDLADLKEDLLEMLK